MPVNTIDRFSDYKIDRSITVLGNVSDAVDYNFPLDFKTWLSFFKDNSVSVNTFQSSYKKYLTAWNKVKNTFLDQQNNLVKENYLSLLKQISLEVYTEQERRFLNAVDYNDPQQLDVLVPLVSNKIQSLTNYYKDFRETVKTTPKKNNIFSSNLGIKSFLTKLISDLLNYNSDTRSLVYKYDKNIGYILANVNYVIDELYDQYDDYYDLTASEPASAYEYGGENRTNQWTSNTNIFDPDLFLNYDNSVVRLLSGYNYILENFISNLSFPVSITSVDTNYLKNKDFINQFNNGNINDLNLINKKKLFEKFSGTDWYYLSTGEVTSTILSGQFLAAQNKSQNYLNRNNVSTATVPNTAFLVTAKDIGGFYTPNNLGVLQYNSFSYDYSLNVDTLSANSIYYFPDPTRYIATYGNSKYSKSTDVFIVNENAYIVNYDISNGAAFGYINDRSEYLNYHGYENREEKNKIYSNGVSRLYDKVDFFKGKNGDVWDNEDVYSIKNKALYPIDDRQSRLAVTQKDLIFDTSDVYGNSYGLYKQSTPREFVNYEDSTNSITQRCLFLSNGLFQYNDTAFNYNDNNAEIFGIIPSQTFIVSDVTMLSGNTFTNKILNKFTFGVFDMPWCFNTGVFYRRGNIYDGCFYVTYKGELFPDSPSSDNPVWSENDNSLYYNILIDGGSDKDGLRPNFIRPATFLKELSSTIDCGVFNYEIYRQDDPFKSNFAIANRYEIPYYSNTINSLSTSYVDESETLRRSIYDKKYVLSATPLFRDINNYVSPLSAALSGIFVKYQSVPDIYSELNDDIIKFDIVFDVAVIETNNYLVVEKIDYDYNTGKVSSYNNSLNYITRTTQGDNKLEKFGNFYFHEKSNTLLLYRSTLLGAMSATNYRTFYPTIYKLELDSLSTKQIFPYSTKNLFGSLIEYSFRSHHDPILQTEGTTQQCIYNMYEADRPVLTYNAETNVYGYVVKTIDSSDCMAFWYQTYKFINGVFTNDINELWFQNAQIRDENYTNPLTGSYIKYNYLQGTNNSSWIKQEGVLKLGE
jgi:hypothetical protein